MDKYVVEITDEALIDLNGIYNYIANTLLAPENAMGQFNRIATAILTLESFPERYPIFDLEPEHSWKMRRMLVDNYLVCYIVEPESGKVIVTDIVFGSSNVHVRLQERHPEL